MSKNKISGNSLIKWYKHDLMILHFLYNISTEYHHHPCIQLTISLHDSPLILDSVGKKYTASGFIIQSNYPHKLNITNKCCFSLMVNPEEPLYHLLAQFTDKTPIHSLTYTESFYLANYFIKALILQHPFDMTYICQLLGRSPQTCLCHSDKRIAKAASIISSLPVKRISSREVASKISLSESRFLHLFRSKLGINFRGYLLWLRLQDVLYKLDSSNTLTTLANDMGFSDSAHFSRTCLARCGLRPSELKRAVIGKTESMYYQQDSLNGAFYHALKTLNPKQ